MGVATCCMLGVVCRCRGVPPAWLCWLPRADMLTAMGTAMGGWFCTTDGGRAGLPPMLEPEACMETAPTIGEDMFCGVFCRTIGDDPAGCDPWEWKRA